MAKIAINIATGSLQQEEMIVGIDLVPPTAWWPSFTRKQEARGAPGTQQQPACRTNRFAGSVGGAFFGERICAGGRGSEKFLVDDRPYHLLGQAADGQNLQRYKNNTASWPIKGHRR